MMLGILIAVLSAPAYAESPWASAWVVGWDRPARLEALGCLREANPFSLAFDAGGKVILMEPALLGDALRLKRRGIAVIPTVVNDVLREDGSTRELKSAAVLERVLGTPAAASRHARRLAALAAAGGWDGIELDYERVPDRLWPAYAAMAAELGTELRAAGRTLAVALEPGELWSEAPAASARWSALIAAADTVKLMAYYENGSRVDAPGPTNSVAWVEATVRRALAVVPPHKLVAAVSAAGTDWMQSGWLRRGWQGERLHYRSVRTLLQATGARPERDERSGMPFFRYERDGRRHEVWFEDERSLADKYAALRRLGVRGVALWYWGELHPDPAASGLCAR